jgi:hypothetical protein
LHNAANSKALEFHILVFVWVLKIELLGNINRLLLIVEAEDLAKILETLLAILIEVFNKSLLLHDFGHVLAQGQLGSWVLCQPIVAFDDVFQETS